MIGLLSPGHDLEKHRVFVGPVKIALQKAVQLFDWVGDIGVCQVAILPVIKQCHGVVDETFVQVLN
ncbi:hypothetical protein ACFSS8_06675 [Paracoccus kondratievae]